MKTSKLILSSGLSLVAFAVAASGYDHGRQQQSGQEVARPPAVAAAPQPTDKDFVPTYLLAAMAACPPRRATRRSNEGCNSRGCCQIEPRSRPATSPALRHSRQFYVSDNNQRGGGATLLDQGLRLMHAFNHPEALRRSGGRNRSIPPAPCVPGAKPTCSGQTSTRLWIRPRPLPQPQRSHAPRNARALSASARGPDRRSR